MSILVSCPQCHGKLRVGDTLLGQRVRCPSCAHVFDSTSEPSQPESTPATPQDLPLDLSLDEPSSSPPPASSGGLVGAVEVNRPGEETHIDPPRAPSPPRRTPRRRDDEDETEWDGPDIRYRGPRRDAEPDRGAVVLTLGIISVAAIVIYCAAPLWAILGIVAWIMGQIDLRKMKTGQMDDRGKAMTQAGWICGIIGTLLNGLLTLGCGLFIGVMWYEEMRRVPNTAPIPAMQPPQQQRPAKGGFPPPNDPKGKKF